MIKDHQNGVEIDRKEERGRRMKFQEEKENKGNQKDFFLNNKMKRGGDKK